MSTWLCDPTTEDLIYQNNQPVLIDGADQVSQAIRKNLKTILGEWFLDLGYGTGWTQNILIKSPTIADAVLKTAIAGTNGVIALTSFNFTLKNQKGGSGVVVSFSAQSEFGPISGVVEVLS